MLGALVVLGGCIQPPPPYVPAYTERPDMAYCFDGVPHIPESKPWALGGRCCCTPSEELMEKLHADGVCVELDVEGLIALYREQEIQLGINHSGCNNLCEYGPHVTKGGKCMAPPTSGTRNYQEVVTGKAMRPTQVATGS
ncbi:MAG TPA: hypothetical protein VM243_08835 [Phycisphaerae bacterium]|nr:hypothetical protein [Phycisphaerae bacterium]